ncbi:hypothetical protein EXE43_12905 [Halorubrum sp. SS5]|nr:hypothetical protein EXE43_12905 [Halorubrum sp. SS5]
MAEQYPPTMRLAYYVTATLLASLVGFIAVSLITAPLWATMAIGGGLDYLQYAVLSLLGWGIYMGQKIVLQGAENVDSSSDLGWIAEALLSLVSVAYYNFVLLLTISIANGIALSGGFIPAIIFAILYPMYEMWTMDEGRILSVGGILVLCLATGMVTARVAQNATRKSIHLDDLPLRFFIGRRFS